MNDISGLDWSSTEDLKRKPPPNYSSAFVALRPTPPTSGRSTPSVSTSQKLAVNDSASASDSFSNLVSFSANNSQRNLSLHEQQKRLAAEKAQKQGHQIDRKGDKLWAGDETFWNHLGSGRSTPIRPDSDGNRVERNDTDNKTDDKRGEDLFADFNESKQIQNEPSSPALITGMRETLDASSAILSRTQVASGTNTGDDDDPFGLRSLNPQSNALHSTSQEDADEGDDVLGLLGRPAQAHSLSPRTRLVTEPVTDTHPQDKAVSELVDMGFPADKAREALEMTDSGVDIQAAVTWLLNKAHAEAREKSQGRAKLSTGSSRTNSSTGVSQHGREPRSRSAYSDDQPSGPPYKDVLPQRNRNQPASSPHREKDPAQLAAELGSTFLKTANSLWKQGAKKVQQAYQEFSSESESSQPKWMRESSPDATADLEARRPRLERDVRSDRRSRPLAEIERPSSVTNEALMLESERPPQRQPPRRKQDTWEDINGESSRDHSPVVPSRLRESTQVTSISLQKSRPITPEVSRKSLSRQAIEEEASQAYISSARKRKPPISTDTGGPAASKAGGELVESEISEVKLTKPQSNVIRQPTKPSPPLRVRTPPPSRVIPSISAISLKACHTHREAGNAHFKRGDYSAAHQSYSISLSHIPQNHPIIIILLTNRALTALKIGEPKTAISDADKAIEIIGASKGEYETVDLQNGETPKRMREYYGKALMRKAEALEQMERWKDASLVWQEAVEGGHGGATSIQGRLRCDKAANPQLPRSKSAPLRKPAHGVRSGRQSALSQANSAAAVNKLRAANAAADKLDDEKFALADTVEARIIAWKGGKADNIRALLASLETVLWPEADWKKISMADLVLPNKVKIQYMKGIAKVHPDKVRL